jgi:glycosyltransferase involved in cell wall biosynthesis
MHVVIVGYTEFQRDPRIRRQVNALLTAGERVTVVALPGSVGEPRSGLTVIEIDARRERGSSLSAYLRGYGAFIRGARRTVATLVAQGDVDLVQTANMPDSVILAATPAHRHGVPIIHDIHDTMPELFREKFHGWKRALLPLITLQERTAVRRARLVLVTHHVVRDVLAGRGHPRAKLRVVLNGVDPTLFAPIERAPEGPPFRLVYHGTMAHRHGLDLAVEAVAALRRSGTDVRLDLMGPGDAVPDLRALVAARGLDEVVHIFEPRAQHLVRDWVTGAHLAVCPMRRNASTDLMVPTKVMEYLMLGLPVIATTTLSTTHYFDDQSVLLVAPDSASALADAIRAALADQAGRARRRAAGLLVAERWSWDRQQHDYLAAVREAVRGERPQSSPASDACLREV